MTTKQRQIIMLLFIAAAFVAGGAVYEALPEQVASHWNIEGAADSYMSKVWGLFLLPIVMVMLFAFYWAIPFLDPLKKNIEAFRVYYDSFWMFILGFFLYIQALLIAWNLGYHFDFTYAIIPAVAALFYIVGIILENSRRNWFIGIRTPWTLSSDVVWEKTHKLGGRLFKVIAPIAFLGLFLRDDVSAILVLAVPAAMIAVVTVLYSFVEYRKLEK